MKHFLVGLIFLLPYYSRAQMSTPVKSSKVHVLGKVTNLATFIGEIDYDVNPENGDTVFSLLYNNYQFTHITDIKSITFSGAGHVLDSLYKIMASVFLPENRKNKEYIALFHLGNEDVSVSTYRQLGTTACRLMNGTSYGLFTQSQLDKLFGKKASTPQNERLD